MSHTSSLPERKAHGDEAHPDVTPPPRRRLALGAIMVLNTAAALIAWAVGLAMVHVGQALLAP